MRLIDTTPFDIKLMDIPGGTEDYKQGYIDGARHVLEEMDEAPTVDAVPLEPLARFIVENLDPRVDCESCMSDFENADRDCRNCPPMSEEQVLDALEKWMEEQNE